MGVVDSRLHYVWDELEKIGGLEYDHKDALRQSILEKMMYPKCCLVLDLAEGDLFKAGLRLQQDNLYKDHRDAECFAKQWRHNLGAIEILGFSKMLVIELVVKWRRHGVVFTKRRKPPVSGMPALVIRALVDDLASLLNLLKNVGVGWPSQSVVSSRSWGHAAFCF